MRLLWFHFIISHFSKKNIEKYYSLRNKCTTLYYNNPCNFVCLYLQYLLDKFYHAEPAHECVVIVVDCPSWLRKCSFIITDETLQCGYFFLLLYNDLILLYEIRKSRHNISAYIDIVIH